MQALNRDGDWNAARSVEMTTERLAMRLLAVNVLAEMMWAKTQDPQRHHG
tara:strand:+ start:1030 stop:1179 length:150 start_codon:yes stop_codon:yes gene_type:complete